MKKITDEQLMRQFQSGDQQALERLIRRYEKELYNFLLKFLGKSSLAEDVFQEAFLQVYISANKFQTHRRFRPWLFTIAANKARDTIRSQNRHPTVQLNSRNDDIDYNDLWDNLLRDNNTADNILQQRQEKQIVRNIIENLPCNLREILLMAYFQRLSYKEMAEGLGIPLGTVKSRLHSAVAAFSRAYKEQYKQYERI